MMAAAETQETRQDTDHSSRFADRVAHYPIAPVFLERWSPRAFDASHMPEADLLTILEAARWAPSAFNIQPWRFLYARRGDNHWPVFVSVLDEFNQAWADKASALVLVLSDTIVSGNGARPDKLSGSHSFDTGAAWAHLALQSAHMGYHTHAMAGILPDAARERLSVPERYRIEIAVAIGRHTDPSVLPEELRGREEPSHRRPLSETAFPGPFPA